MEDMKAIEEQLDRLADSLRIKMENRIQATELGASMRKLPKPRVLVMEAKRSKRILGWYSAERWKQGVVKLDEIVLTPASVSKGVFNADFRKAEIINIFSSAMLDFSTFRDGKC